MSTSPHLRRPDADVREDADEAGVFTDEQLAGHIEEDYAPGEAEGGGENRPIAFLPRTSRGRCRAREARRDGGGK